MLQDIRFDQGEIIIYDPYNSIANKRKQYMHPSYENTFSLELHRVANIYDWG